MAPCEDSDSDSLKSSYDIDTIFPKFPITKTYSIAPLGKGSDGNNFSPAPAKRHVIVCITYRDDIENRLRHTRMLFSPIPENPTIIVDPYFQNLRYGPVEGFVLRDSEEDQ